MTSTQSPDSGTLNISSPYPPLLTVAILAFFVSAITLSEKGFWGDEVYALRISSDLSVPFTDPDPGHPPLYYVLLGLFLKAFGLTEFNARLLSVFFSLIGIAVTYLLARELYGQRCGIIATLLLSLNPWWFHYALNVKMYSMLGALSAVSTYFLIKSILARKNTYWIAYALSIAAGLYTHYYFPPVIFVHAVYVYLIAGRAIHIRPFTLSILLASLLFLPWVATLLEQIGGLDEVVPSGNDRPPLTTVWLYVLVHAAGGWSLFYVHALLLALSLIVRRTHLPSSLSLFVMPLFVLIGHTLLLSWITSTSYFSWRTFIYVAPCLSIVSAYFLVQLPYPMLRLGALVILLFLSAAYLSTEYFLPFHPAPKALLVIEKNLSPQDTIYFLHSDTSTSYYINRDPNLTAHATSNLSNAVASVCESENSLFVLSSTQKDDPPSVGPSTEQRQISLSCSSLTAQESLHFAGHYRSLTLTIYS